MTTSVAGPLNLGILLFNEVEVLDFCGPFEVFSVTGDLHKETFNKVVYVSETKSVKTRGGMQVTVDHVIGDEIPNLDVLLIPGGYGTIELVKNEKVIDWVKKLAPSLKAILTVCTGVSIAGKCGLLDNKIYTTHHLCYDFVSPDCPNSKLCKCRRFIDNDPVFTSAGISAGIDLALYFVKKNFGADIADQTADFMEYDWTRKDPGSCTCGAETMPHS